MYNFLAFFAGSAGGSLDTFDIIIGASIIILLSYSFEFIAKKAKIPSVILLIGLGVALAAGLSSLGMDWGQESIVPALEILGTIGLILIVLEAALDLKLKKEKTGLITRAFVVALLVLLVTVAAIGFTLYLLLDLNVVPDDYIQSIIQEGGTAAEAAASWPTEAWIRAFIYATSLSIMSSAIVIPSVGGLSDNKREFMIYEATFSDILGIILFFFLTTLNLADKSLGDAASTQIVSILVTILISIVISYALVFFISKVTKKANFFTIFALLSLFYAGGKKLHLSSLIMILIFGLVLYNHKLFFKGWFRNLVDEKKQNRILEDFKLLTHQSAFLVRTFFFVVFGMIISFAALKDINVVLISLAILLIIYLVRFAHLWLVQDHTSILPELFIAPRGLITVLLFFTIPATRKLTGFNEGIMFVVIIVSALIMMFALIFAKKDYTVIEDISIITDDEILGFGREEVVE